MEDTLVKIAILLRHLNSLGFSVVRPKSDHESGQSTPSLLDEDGWEHIDLAKQPALPDEIVCKFASSPGDDGGYKAEKVECPGEGDKCTNVLSSKPLQMPQVPFNIDLDLDHSVLPFTLSEVEYAALPPCAHLTLPSDGRSQLLTVIPAVEDGVWTMADVEDFLETGSDDVSRPEFQKFLLFCRTPRCAAGTLDMELKQYLEAHGIFYQIKTPELSRAPSPHDAKQSIRGGPYLWRQESLHQVCRLYDDTASAFLQSLLPLQTTESDFIPLRITGKELRTISVAVPSRQQTRSRQQIRSLEHRGVIRGKRILVKDIFALRGLRISACNRAYYEAQETATETAYLIQCLVDSGADIVGLGKLSSMISREEPGESLDFQVPFNPRSDGYQSPAGSSSGEAAAIAKYPWLDYAIGSDSTGSGRRPAFFNGCFSARLSSDPVKYTKGMMPCFPMFDAPSIFCREITGLADFIHEWCGLEPVIPLPKPTIVCIDGIYTSDDKQQRTMIDHFARQFGEITGTSVTHVNLKDSWRQAGPSDADNKELNVYMRDVARTAFFHDFYESSREFREFYQTHNNHRPPVNAVTRYRWEIAAGITAEQRSEAGRKLDIYKSWLEGLLFKDDEFPIVVVPIAKTSMNDRDAHPSNTYVQDAWDPLLLAPILKAPELTVPIDQMKEVSAITQTEQYLPFAVSVLSKPGTDLTLIHLVEQFLRDSGRPCFVKTGAQTFDETWSSTGMECPP